jgi:hypothetical protein
MIGLLALLKPIKEITSARGPLRSLRSLLGISTLSGVSNPVFQYRHHEPQRITFRGSRTFPGILQYTPIVFLAIYHNIMASIANSLEE